jgi:hypothetical protein
MTNEHNEPQDTEKHANAIQRLLAIRDSIADLKGGALHLFESNGNPGAMQAAIEYMRSGWLRMGVALFPLTADQLTGALVQALQDAGSVGAVLEDLTTISELASKGGEG